MAKPQETTTPPLKLPSGRPYTVRAAKGRDMLQAGRMVGAADQANLYAIQMALVAACCTVDGQPLAYEDVLDLDAGDVGALMAAVGNPPASTAPTS